MIIKTYPNRNIYGKYFLATEAPDDEEVTEEQPKPRRNVKVISVKPSNRNKDFTQVGNPPITPDDVDDTEDIDVDSTDYGTEPTEEIPEENIQDTNEQQPETEPAVNDDETQPTETPVDEPVIADGENVDTTGNDGPDTGVEADNVDYTADEADVEGTGEEGPVLCG